MNEVGAEIKQKRTYKQTYDELNYSCKVAWRNAPRCINRIQWSRMDCRDGDTATVFSFSFHGFYYLFQLYFFIGRAFSKNVLGT